MFHRLQANISFLEESGGIKPKRAEVYEMDDVQYNKNRTSNPLKDTRERPIVIG